MAKKDDKLKEEEKDISDLNQDELEEAIGVEKESVEKPKEETEELEEGKPQSVKDAEEETEKTEETEEEAETKQETKIPEKLKGKSKEDIVQMYMESEKRMHGATQNEAEYKKKTEQYRQMLSDKYDFNENGEIIGSKSSPQQETDHWEVLEQQTGLPRENLKPLMAMFDMRQQQRERAMEEKFKPILESQNKNKYQQLKNSLKSDLKYIDKYEKEMDDFVEKRKIPYDSLTTEDAVKTIYQTVLGQHYEEAVEKKKTQEAKLKADSEKEKSEARVEQSTKTPVETTSTDSNEMTLEQLENKLPHQEI